MPKVREFVVTPNPNALKCVLDAPLPAPASGVPSPRSYRSADQARGDALGLRLLEIPGVVNVLIHTDWIAIGKGPEADWKAIRSAVAGVLESA